MGSELLYFHTVYKISFVFDSCLLSFKTHFSQDSTYAFLVINKLRIMIWYAIILSLSIIWIN